jgi:hypothetical protein
MLPPTEKQEAILYNNTVHPQLIEPHSYLRPSYDILLFPSSITPLIRPSTCPA